MYLKIINQCCSVKLLLYTYKQLLILNVKIIKINLLLKKLIYVNCAPSGPLPGEQAVTTP